MALKWNRTRRWPSRQRRRPGDRSETMSPHDASAGKPLTSCAALNAETIHVARAPRDIGWLDRHRRRDGPTSQRQHRRSCAARRARDVRQGPAIPRQDADRQRRLGRRPERAGHHRHGPDGVPGLRRGPQLRLVQQQRPPGGAKHHRRPGRQHGLFRQQHVPSRLRHARPGRGLRRRR